MGSGLACGAPESRGSARFVRHLPQPLGDQRDQRVAGVDTGAALQAAVDHAFEADGLHGNAGLAQAGGQPGLHRHAWERITKTLNWICKNWDQPDEGIWQIRSGRRHFLSSRLMCWVALDRGLRRAQKRSVPSENAGVWEKNRSLIYRDIHENFWCEARGAFTQYKGGTTLDASTLLMPLMPLMPFITPHDPRWLSTQRVIERELTSDVLVRRYETGGGGGSVDGLDGEEGAFTPCSFRLVECLARSGNIAGPACISRSSSPTPTISACSRRRSGPAASSSATLRRR